MEKQTSSEESQIRSNISCDNFLTKSCEIALTSNAKNEKASVKAEKAKKEK